MVRGSGGDGPALLAIGAMFLVNGAVYGTWAARMPELRDQVATDVGTLGLILGLAGAIGLLGSLAAGLTVDRFGSRANIVVAGTLMCAALVPIGVTGSVWVLAAGLATLSLADTVTDVGMNLQGAQISARRRRPVVNRLHGMWSLGAVSGGVTGAVAAGWGVGLGAHFGLMALVLMAAVAAAGLRLLPHDDQLPESGAGNGRRWTTAGSSLALLGALGFLGTIVEIIPSDWSALRLADDLGAAPDTAGAAFVAFSASMLAGRLIGDFVVEHIGPHRVMVAAPVVCGLGLAAATLAPTVVVSLTGFAVAGLGASVLFPLIYARAATTPGVNPGRGLAFMTAGQKSAILLAPVAVGFLADRDALGVGQAIACLVLPAAAALLAVGARDGPRAGTRG